MGERRPRRRPADRDPAGSSWTGPAIEVAPEVTRARAEPEPADVVRRSAALGGNAAALRTAHALGFASGDLNADVYTGEEPPDFFFGTLAELDAPIPVRPEQDSPPAARAAINLTVSGPSGPAGAPVVALGSPLGSDATGEHAAAEPVAEPGTQVGTEAQFPGAASIGGAGPKANALPAAAGGTTSAGMASGPAAPAAAGSAPATAVGPAAVDSPRELVTAVSTAAGRIAATRPSAAVPPDIAAGRAFPVALTAPLGGPGTSRMAGGEGGRRPTPQDDLPPDPVPSATKAVEKARDDPLPDLKMPDVLAPPHGPLPKLVYPPELQELGRPKPPDPPKKAPKRPKPKKDEKGENVAPETVPKPEPFVPPVLLDLRQPPMAVLDPKLKAAEQSKIRTVIASVKADLPTVAKPFVRQLRDSTEFGTLLGRAYEDEPSRGIWESTVGDEVLLKRLTEPMNTKLGELADAAGLSGSILDQAVQEKQQELIAAGRAVSDKTRDLVRQRAPVVIGDAEKRAAAEQAKLAKEHAERLRMLRRAMASRDPAQVRALADERIAMLNDRIATGVVAFEDAALRRNQLLEIIFVIYRDAYRAVDDRAQAALRATAAAAAQPAPPPSVVQVPSLDDGRPWFTWAVEQLTASMKALRTRTQTDRDARIRALRQAGATGVTAIHTWADKRLRHQETAQEKEDRARAEFTATDQAITKARAQAAKDKARDDLVAQIRFAEAFHDARQAEASGKATDAQKKMLAEGGKAAAEFLGGDTDPLAAVARHLGEQMAGSVVRSEADSGELTEAVKGLRAKDTAQAITLGNVIFGPKPPDATTRADKLWSATGGQWGTDEDEVFRNLDNLSQQQIHTIGVIFQEDHGETLYSRLDSELSGSEWDRAKALLGSDQVGAVAAAIRYETNSWFSAPDQGKIADAVRTLPPGQAGELKKRFGESARWYNSSSASLDDVLGDSMRTYKYDQRTGESTPDNRSSEQIGLLLQINMLKKQPEPAQDAGGSKPPSPKAKTMPSVIDSQDVQNRIDVLQAKADAFELDVALRPAYGPAKADAMDTVFTRMRTEIAGANPAWTQEQVDNELRRRTANVERTYGQQFPALVQVNNFGTPMQNLRPQDSRLRQVMAANLYQSGEKEIGGAMLDVDRRAERTARILLADRGAYAADSDVNAGLETSYTQAADEVRRREGPAMQKERARRIREAQEKGKPLRPNEIAALDRADDRTLEEQIKKRAKELLAETVTHFKDTGHGSLKEWVEDKTQFNGETEAMWRLDGGGGLSRAQQLWLAVDGWGHDTEEAKKALAGRTPDEIAKISKEFTTISNDKRTWPWEPANETLSQRLHRETSGEDRFDLDEALEGEPPTAKERMAALTRRYEYNRTTYFGGSGPPASVAGSMRILKLQYEASKRAYDRLEHAEATLSVEDQVLLQQSFEAEATRSEARAQEYRQRVHAYTDELVQVLAMAAALVVVGLVEVFSLGLATPVVALLASLAATATTIATKAVVLGKAYGTEELIDDVVIGAVDAAVATATAGLGDKLLGVTKVAGKGAAREALEALARAQRAAKPMIARMGAFVAENVAGAAPSALAANLTNRQNWRGDMFANVARGTLLQIGTNLGIGGATHQAMKQSGTILRSVLGAAAEKFRGWSATHSAIAAAERAADAPAAHAGPPHVADHAGAPHVSEGGGPRVAEVDGVPRLTEPGGPAHVTEPAEPVKLRTDSTGASLAFVETHPDAVHQQQRNMRREVLAEIPRRERAAYTDTPIVVLSDAEYVARTGSERKGMATVLIENGKPVVVIREGAPLWSLREEGRHLKQLADPRYAEHLRLLDESRLGNWKNLSLQERMLSAQAHLELELAAQRDAIAALAHQKLVGRPDPHLQARLDAALRAQEALSARMDELRSFRGSPEGSPPPVFLEEPSRLNAKSDKTAKAGPAPPAPPSAAEKAAIAAAEAELEQARIARDQVMAERKKLGPELAELTRLDQEVARLELASQRAREPAERARLQAAAKEKLAEFRQKFPDYEKNVDMPKHPNRGDPDAVARSALSNAREAIRARAMGMTEAIGKLDRFLVGEAHLDPKKPRAGHHNKLDKQGGDGHHMPANNALAQAVEILENAGDPRAGNKLLTEAGGGAMQMIKEDHYETASHGSGGGNDGPDAYRAKQAALIVEGKYLEAVKMDIDDIRGNPMLRSRYEKVIQEFLNFLQKNQSLVDQLNQKSGLKISDLRTPTPVGP